ncbi:MAG: hypothetical protein Q7U14_10670, partial [Lacisediminimonas sp.]|nr:hypothetical protein [Lacisediminimonas sp.]
RSRRSPASLATATVSSATPDRNNDSLLGSPQHDVLVKALMDYTQALEEAGLTFKGKPRERMEDLWAGVREPDTMDWDLWQLQFMTFGFLHEPASNMFTIDTLNLAVLSACRGMQK